MEGCGEFKLASTMPMSYCNPNPNIRLSEYTINTQLLSEFRQVNKMASDEKNLK